MRSPREDQAVREVALRLADLLGHPPLKTHRLKKDPRGRLDLVLEAAGRRFLVEYKRSGAAGPVWEAIDKLSRPAATRRGRDIPVVAVPYMGPTGRDRCARAGVSWLDLSGNACILAPGLRVLVEGKANRYKNSGRPASVFSPNASRVARWFLLHPGESIRHERLSLQTGVDKGYLTRIVRKLEADAYLRRSPDAALHCPKPGALLDEWRDEYDFLKHDLLQGHIPARSGEVLLSTLARSLSKPDIEYAATGLAGAWLLTHYAGFRLTTVYVKRTPAPSLLDSLSFRNDPKGANVWFVVPADDGVFHGAREIDGIRCAHPVQVYLDLKAHPERASEAADQLRTQYLKDLTDAQT